MRKVLTRPLVAVSSEELYLGLSSALGAWNQGRISQGVPSGVAFIEEDCNRDSSGERESLPSSGFFWPYMSFYRYQLSKLLTLEGD